jgi:hypothetical protein
VAEIVQGQLAAAGVKGSMGAVTIASGHAATFMGSARWHVAKRVLARVLQLALSNRRLHVRPELPEVATLVRELGGRQIAAEASVDAREAKRRRERKSGRRGRITPRPPTLRQFLIGTTAGWLELGRTAGSRPGGGGGKKKAAEGECATPGRLPPRTIRYSFSYRHNRQGRLSRGS